MDPLENIRILAESGGSEGHLSAIDRARLINNDPHVEGRYTPLLSLVEDVRAREESRRKDLRRGSSVVGRNVINLSHKEDGVSGFVTKVSTNLFVCPTLNVGKLPEGQQ